MILIICCVALSCYLLYTSSRRLTVLSSDKLHVWLQYHPKITKLTGFVMLSISMIIAVLSIGFSAGIFTVIFAMMALWSLLLLLIPLYIVNYKHILLLIILLSIINYYS